MPIRIDEFTPPIPARTNAVPARLIGKTSDEEVLVHGWERTSGTTHRVTARWPQVHRFYNPPTFGGSFSPLLFVETVRQALSLLCHEALHIPLEHRLGWSYCASTADPNELVNDSRPGEVELEVVHAVPDPRKKSRSARLTAHVQASRNGRPLGAAHIKYTAHPPALYNRLRGEHADAHKATDTALPPGPPLPAELVSRADAADVVISPTDAPRRWLLRADTTHPILFDHAHDHMPGMVLLEAASQAVLSMAAPRQSMPMTFRTEFNRYVELDAPCWIEASPLIRLHGDIGHSEVRGIQHDQTVFTTQIVTRG
ncbi:ScbA/BarX family gamma-butyrolactone biosynthesis protein [Streptomyces longisporoflavus]|uniref:ScbA/BarX family gamma-butyrolactone biosynthesis protein n=1 Tax=Streptomyces longisporoflavus TaxID=28044 RepID=A0ABW7R3Z4_9ACTN